MKIQELRKIIKEEILNLKEYGDLPGWPVDPPTFEESFEHGIKNMKENGIKALIHVEDYPYRRPPRIIIQYRGSFNYQHEAVQIFYNTPEEKQKIYDLIANFEFEL